MCIHLVLWNNLIWIVFFAYTFFCWRDAYVEIPQNCLESPDALQLFLHSNACAWLGGSQIQFLQWSTTRKFGDPKDVKSALLTQTRLSFKFLWQKYHKTTNKNTRNANPVLNKSSMSALQLRKKTEKFAPDAIMARGPHITDF